MTGLFAINKNIVVMVLANLANSLFDLFDWRMPLITYLRDPNVRTGRSIWWTTFNYVLIGDELYRQTINDIMFKCLVPDDAILVMFEVYEGICSTH